MAYPPHMIGFNPGRFPTVPQSWTRFQANFSQDFADQAISLNLRLFRPVYPAPIFSSMVRGQLVVPTPTFQKPLMSVERFAPPGKVVVHAVPVPPPPAITYRSMSELPVCQEEEVMMMSCSFRLPQDLNEENLHAIDLLYAGGPTRLTIYCDPKDEPVKSFWFPYGFNQNVINGRFTDDGTLRSSACTLIAVLQACNIEKTDHRIRYFGKPPEEHKDTIALFMSTMGEANRLHLDMIRDGALDENCASITIPHARKILEHKDKILAELKFYDQRNLSGKSFCTAFFHGINQAIKRFYLTFPVPHTPRNLYLVMIVDQRSMVLVHQTDSGLMTFFDSHCHVPHGAVMAQVKENELMAFCRWYEEVCQKVYHALPYRFEISCMVSDPCARARELGLDIGFLHPRFNPVRKADRGPPASSASSGCSSLPSSPLVSPTRTPNAASAGASKTRSFVIRLPSSAPDGTNAEVYRTVIPIGSIEEQEGRRRDPGDRVGVTIAKGQCCCSKVRIRRHSCH